MTLICMLIALIIERLAVRSQPWQWVSYVRPYLKMSQQGPLAMLQQHAYGVFFWWLLPALLVTLALTLVDFWLFTLIVNTLVLLVCMGCWRYRQLYKQYLNAQARADQQAAFLVMQQIRQQAGFSSAELTHGQQLVWLNFKYYAAVLFWFALLGAFGAIAYAMLRQLAEPGSYTSEADTAEVVDAVQSAPTVQAASTEQTAAAASAQTGSSSAAASDNAPELVTAESTDPSVQAESSAAEPSGSQPQALTAAEDYVRTVAQDLSHLADWLPARLFGVGFALVGHFSKASATLMRYGADLATPAEQVLTEVAQAAEPLRPEQLNSSDESTSMVQLSKRNILFFLALVAVLTLSGLLA
jgi:AmpE protein